MAKPLHERIASARSTDRVTITDLETIIAEIRAERNRFGGIVAQATADSIRFELSEHDRDEAAAAAARAKRNALAMSAALEELSAKLDAKRESESQRERRAAEVEILAERDELADRLRIEWPLIEARVVELLSALQANEARMKGAQIYQANAEAVARDCPGNFMTATGPVRRLADTKLAAFADFADLAWPRPQRLNPNMHMDGYLSGLKAGREERARWQRYVVTPPADNRDPIPLTIRLAPSSIRDRPVVGLMTADGAEAARKLGCTVEMAGSDLSVGIPAAAATF